MTFERKRPMMPKRSINISGHATSVSLQDAFWKGFKEIAAIRKMKLSELASEIDALHDPGDADDAEGVGGLSSAIRVYVLLYFMERARDAEQRANDNAEKAAALKELIDARDRAAKVCGNLAPLSTVIAGGRTNV